MPRMIEPEQVRDALVDAGAACLSAPKRIIENVGRVPHGTCRLRTANGTIERNVYGGVRLTIQDRDFLCDVTEVPDDCAVLIGQIPLEGIDFVVDPVGRRLIGNPAHGGVAMHEEF
jgi:predicted aspartyl protease